MKNKKIINIITIVVFIGFVFSLSAVFVLKPADAESPEERRKLQQFPVLTFENVRQGEFTSKMNDYLNDQFPFRNSFRYVKYLAEQLLLKKDNNGVISGKNGQLAVRLFNAAGSPDKNSPLTDKFFEENLDVSFDKLKEYTDYLKEKNIPISVILPPRTIDVAVSAFDYPSETSDELIKSVRKHADNNGYMYFIDMYDIYRERYDNNEYVYFKTDHHWTVLGAYYAYAEIMRSFGETPYGINEFEAHLATDSFFGTTWAKLGDINVTPDSLDYWTLPTISPEKFEMSVSSGRVFDTFYDESYLNGYDKYSFFMSGTNKLTHISLKDGTKREKLLVLKDSFGHSLSPFLALHYDLTVVNLADAYDVSKLVKDEDFDKVLICFNLENIITTDNLGKAKALINN